MCCWIHIRRNTLTDYTFHFIHLDKHPILTYVILSMCFGSLSCWNIPPLPGSWSHLVDHVRDALYKCHLSNTLCTHAAPYHRTPTSSVSGLCVHSGSSGQVRAKRLVVHPILTFFPFPSLCFGLIRPKNVLPLFIM